MWADATLEACVASVAALCAGVPLVPVNPKLGRSELEHVLTDSRPDVILGAPDGALPALEHPPRALVVDAGARGGALPDVRGRRRGPRADHLHVGHDGPAQGRDPARAARSPRTSTRWPTPGSGRRRRARPRAPALPRPRPRRRPVRAAAPRRRAAPPRPLRPGGGRGRAARRRDDAVRRPDDVPPPRPGRRRGRRDRRRPARRPAARLGLGPAPGPRVQADRGRSPGSRSSSATASPRR